MDHSRPMLHRINPETRDASQANALGGMATTESDVFFGGRSAEVALTR
jgi:hypothetical protein